MPIDLHIGTPTLSGLDVPMSQRLHATIEGPAVEAVSVPISGATVVQVSLNGGATWRAVDLITGGVRFPVAGWDADLPSVETWRIPPGTEVWVYLRSVDGDVVQVRKAAQPIVTTGESIYPPPEIGLPEQVGNTISGYGAPGDIEVPPGTVYVDLETGTVYEWSD